MANVVAHELFNQTFYRDSVAELQV